VNNDLHNTSRGQSTHQDSVKKNLPTFFFFNKFYLRRSFSQNILPAALDLTQKNLVCGVFDFSAFFTLPMH